MGDFDALYQRYLRDVYRYVYSLCHDRDAAEELTQITFSIAFEKMDSFRGDSQISTWLYGIARLEYMSWRRKRKKQEAQSMEEEVGRTVRAPGKEPVELLIHQEESEQIHRILHELPEPYKEVFMLRVMGEMPYRSIGKLFGKGESWGRVTYYRAKKMIIERMEGDDVNEM